MPSLDRSYDNRLTTNETSLALKKHKPSNKELDEGEEKSASYGLNSDIDISSVAGYLFKDKSDANAKANGALSFLQSKSNRRYFKVITMQGMEGNELAVAYYKQENSKDIRGWIFSKDIIEINEDKVSFTIVSPSRSLTCRADSGKEHNMWVDGLRAICPGVRFISDGVEVVAGSNHLPLSIKQDGSDKDKYEENDNENFKQDEEDNYKTYLKRQQEEQQEEFEDDGKEMDEDEQEDLDSIGDLEAMNVSKDESKFGEELESNKEGPINYVRTDTPALFHNEHSLNNSLGDLDSSVCSSSIDGEEKLDNVEGLAEEEKDDDEMDYETWKRKHLEELQKTKKKRHEKKQSIDSKVKDRARLQQENRERERGQGETATSRIANHIRKGSKDMAPISLTPSPYYDNEAMYEEITLEDHRPTEKETLSNKKKKEQAQDEYLALQKAKQREEEEEEEERRKRHLREEEEEKEERERNEALELRRKQELEQQNRPRVRRTAAEEFKDDTDLNYMQETNRRKSSFLFERNETTLGTDSEDEGTVSMDSLLHAEKESLKRENKVNNVNEDSESKSEEREGKIMSANNHPTSKATSKVNMTTEKDLPYAKGKLNTVKPPDSKYNDPPPVQILQKLKKAKAPIYINQKENTGDYAKGQQETKQSEGIKYDENFVEENWDEDSDGDHHSSVPKVKTPSFIRGEGKQEEKESLSSRRKKTSEVTVDGLAGVQTDQNFVEDDWDA